jgi:hypothetical protein
MGSIDGSESNGLPVGSTNNPAKLAPLSLDQDHSTLPVTPESHLLSGRNQPLETEKKQTHLRNSFNACALTLFNAWLLRQSSKVVTRFISTLFICSPILFFLGWTSRQLAGTVFSVSTQLQMLPLHLRASEPYPVPYSILS